MDKYIYDENNGLWYERCGDYYLPCLVLPEQKSIGRWGQKYRVYLRKHKREVYNAFQAKGTLNEHVAKIDQQAEEMFERLVDQIAMRQGITEQLKADDQMSWVREALNKSPHPSWRQIFRPASLKNLEIHQVFLRFFASRCMKICSPIHAR